jgi:transmembrane sensor
MEINYDVSYTNLIVSFLSGELNHSEEESLMQWLKEDPERLVLFEEYRNLWISTSVSSFNRKVNTNASWLKVCKLAENKKVTLGRAGYTYKRILSIAASILIVFILGGLSFKFFDSKGPEKTAGNISTIVTPLGSKTSIFLPDGTHVWLNAGSKLTYDGSFDINSRLVYLEGEAYFKVKTDKSKPFIVRTSKINVKALGTTFNVMAYPEEKLAVATLVEGVIDIEVTGKNKKNISYTLKPRQNVTIIDNNISIGDEANIHQPDPVITKVENIKRITEKVLVTENIKTELYTSWKDKRWIISRERLDDLAVKLGRRYDVSIRFADEALKTFRFTGTIQDESLEQVLKVMSLSSPILYEVDGKTVIFGENKDFLKKYKGLYQSESNLN